MIKKRGTAFLIAVAMLFVTNGSVFAANNTIRQEKLVGSDRYKTAIEISKVGWTQSDTAIIVNGKNIASALCATPFAKLKNAPILLVNDNNIEGSTKSELKRLGVKNVYIVDSNNTVSKNVENNIKSLGINVFKISGNSIYDMSLNVAKEINKIKGFNKIVVVNGEKGLSDAVSIASPAASETMPIILLSQNNSNNQSLEYIKDKNIQKTYVVGGEKTLPNSVVNRYPNKERLYGLNRDETNAMVLNKFYPNKQVKNVFIAKNGIGKESALVDSLAIGVLASKNTSPVVISNGNLNKSQNDFINSKNIREITQVGGGESQKTFEKVLVSKGEKIRNNTKKITILEAKEILKNAVPGGNILVCYYDEDDNEYDGKVEKDNYIYEVEIDGFNGKVLDIEKELKDNDDLDALNPTNISLEQAKEIMVSSMPGSKLIDCKFDKEDNEYEGKIENNNKIYEIEVSGFDGRIIEIEEEDDSDSTGNNQVDVKINEEQAKEIMLKKVPGATIIKFKYDSSDKEYEAKLKKDKQEYEITVSATSGEITEFKID